MTQTIIKIPKVFISYSWATKAETEALAKRLQEHGVNVIVDIWSLEPGQDKYAFIEQCVTDDNIDRVLIICDKSYAEKANSRNGEVGDETMIISPEVCRIYIDISGDYYEEGYEKLLRTLFEQPESRKPPLGTPPESLFKEENASLLPLKEAVRKLEAHDFRRVNKNNADDFMPDTFLDDFRAIKKNRNTFSNS